MPEKVIEIKNLNFSYPDKTSALRSVNLDISRGESLGIIGPNGAGKSTLLLHLNGILRGDGLVRILDMNMEDKNLSRIRHNVGLVFQDPDNQLFMPTVFDDVSFGPLNMALSKAEVEKAAEEALAKVKMENFAKRSSHHLSFGEKKKISVATVLSMKPEILALDEPTSNLDPAARFDFMQLLKEFNKTKIVASHDLDMIFNICERVVVLNKGTIVADGNKEDILFDTPLLKEHGLISPFAQETIPKK